MSWPRFAALVAGLSGSAMFRQVRLNRPISNPVQAMAALDAMVGT